MFRFLARSALATVIFKRYRRPIISTLVLFLSYFLISTVHEDYVNYAVTAEDRHYLWLSFVLKWVLLLTVTAVYYFYNMAGLRANRPRPPKPPTPSQKSSVASPKQVASLEADPFAEIRRKSQLQGRGDRLLENPPSGREK